MTKLKFILQAAALVVFTLAFTSFAQAQATRTWVSGVGDDVNPCSRTAPCKTWAGAISKTAAGGEINALDPGGYGTLTITKSLTVDGTTGAGWGSTLNSGGINGFVINDSLSAAPGTSRVILRNLSINGAGATAGLNGIRFLRGLSLKVENSRIANQTSHGIDINQTQAGEVHIDNTVISNCAGSGINQNAGSVLTHVNNTTVIDCGTGMTNAAGLLNISNSVVSNNTNNGLSATSGAALTNAVGNVVTNNGSAGISATGGSLVRVSNNDVFRNGTGLSNTASTMETFRNNRVRGNVADLAGALTDVSAVGTGIQ